MLRPHTLEHGHTLELVHDHLSRLDSPPKRQVVIVTTAALPWRTGTAVNPCLRAAYLAHLTSCQVTLAVPWLSSHEQAGLFPDSLVFHRPDEQEAYIKKWVASRCGFEATFSFAWYPAKYDTFFMSIMPTSGGDVLQHIPKTKRDVAILEEPEHLSWFNRSFRWSLEFNHVIGIMHTNYIDYVRRDAGIVGAQLMRKSTEWLTRIHCHKVIKLSDAIQPLPRAVTQFVHGVAKPFLATGERLAARRGQTLSMAVDGSQTQAQTDPGTGSNDRAAEEGSADGASRSEPLFDKGAYFIGKAVWGKGYSELLERLAEQKAVRAGGAMPIDIFGTGEDLGEIKSRAAKLGLNCSFLGARDHMDDSIAGYRVFVNASTSDVVATTSAEALAMGKWLVCPRHPENAFFEQFANALIYENPHEFSEQLAHALANDPPPLTDDDHRRLTWEDATTRLLEASQIAPEEWPTSRAATKDAALWTFYKPFTGIDVLRTAIGKRAGGQEAREDLARATSMEPSGQSDSDAGYAEDGSDRRKGSFPLSLGWAHSSESSGVLFRSSRDD